MNVYEEAHNLQRAIKESEEYKSYMAAKAKVDSKPELKAMVDDFQKKAFELQTQIMAGKMEENNEAMAKVGELNQILMGDPVAAEYLQTQMRLGIMMQDVYKILSEVTPLDV